MIRTGRKKEWSILLFVVCLVALTPPMLSLFDVASRVLGIPLSFLYLFGLWAFAIIMTALGARRGTEKTIELPEAQTRVDRTTHGRGKM